MILRLRHKISLASLVVAVVLALFGSDVSAAEQPLKVCLVSGSLEYKSNESLAGLQKYLEANFPVRCTRAFIEGTDETRLPGLENLDDCDVMLLFTRRLKLSGQDLQRIKAYCLAGKPIVGVRTASHGIQTWLELDREVFGGNYHGHYGAEPMTEVAVAASGKDHPLLSGVRPFRSLGSLYKNEGLAADNVVLLTGSNGQNTEAIAWTRQYKGARIFYTSLGHPQDFAEESFRRLLVNALFWTTKRDLPSSPDAKSLAAASIALQKDVVYGTAAGEELRLDLVVPAGLGHPAPAIVWIHGGAWRGGDKREFESFLRESAGAGYVAVSINYRLAPKHIFPAQVEDSKCAVRWLRANAERLHVDPKRIGAVGSSAGAHLAMMLGAMEPSDGLEGDGGAGEMSSRVQAVVSYAGPTNLCSPFPAITGPLLATFLGGPVGEKLEAARAASPLTYVGAGDPPMLLIQGTKDPLVSYGQAYQMAEALTKVGVAGRVELLLGEGHGWPTQQACVSRRRSSFLIFTCSRSGRPLAI